MSDGVWRRTLEDGGRVEVAFGQAALERSMSWLDKEIATLRARQQLDAEQELKLFELLVRRERLVEAREALADKLTETATQSVCWGAARFEHTYDFGGSVSPYVISSSIYTEFGPLSSGTKTAYASARICSPKGNHCDQTSDSQSIGSDWAVGAVTTPATISPYWTCEAEAFGYVLAVQSSGCTDIKSLSTHRHCQQFY